MTGKIVKNTCRDNKSLSLITIIVVAISCSLILTVGFLFSSIRDFLINEVKEKTGSYHLIIYQTSDISEDYIEKIKVSNGKTYITFKNPSKSYKYGKDLCQKKCTYNKELLYFYGLGENNILVKIIIFILTIISLFVFIMIKNIFDLQNKINKKRLGIISALGGTKKLIRKILLYTSLVLSLIGIILGIILSIIITLIILNIVSNNLDTISLRFSFYKVYFIISIIFILLIIILSSIISSSKITKNNIINNIKGNTKNKNFNIIKKVFGIPAFLARNNYEHNKKEYKSVSRCVWVSIILFISVFLIMEYTSGVITKYVIKPKYDGEITASSLVSYNSVIDANKLTDYLQFNACHIESSIDINNYNIKELHKNKVNIMLVNYDNKNTFLLNRVNEVVHRNNKLFYYDNQLFKKTFDLKLENETIKNIPLEENVPKFLENYTTSTNIVVNVPDITKYKCDYFSSLLYNGKVKKQTIPFEANVYDAKKATDMINMIIVGVKIFIYCFIIFILSLAFIGIISITVGNLNIRKKEIAILNSMGFNKFNFFKMLFYESLFICLKPFLIALILTIIISLFMYYSVNLAVTLPLIFPYKYLFKIMIYMFLLVFIFLYYAFSYLSKKIIISNIKDENI